jgi:hypothetical protein
MNAREIALFSLLLGQLLALPLALAVVTFLTSKGSKK